MNSWIFFALLAPFLWALSNVLDGTLRKTHIKSDYALTWFFAMSRLPFVIVFFWLAGIVIPDTTAVLLLFIGGLLWTIPFSLYFRAMESEEPSRIALLLQFTPLFTLLIASIALQEKLTSFQGIAFAFLVIGGALASVKRLEKKWTFSKAFFLIALATLLWALSDILFKKYEVVFDQFFSAFAIYFFGSFVVSLFMFLHNKGRQNITQHFSKLPFRVWVMLLFSMFAGIGGSASFAYALTLGKASLTSVMIGIQPLFVLLLSLVLSLFMKEIYREDLHLRALIFKGFSFVCILLGLIFLQI